MVAQHRATDRIKVTDSSGDSRGNHDEYREIWGWLCKPLEILGLQGCSGDVRFVDKCVSVVAARGCMWITPDFPRMGRSVGIRVVGRWSLGLLYGHSRGGGLKAPHARTTNTPPDIHADVREVFGWCLLGMFHVEHPRCTGGGGGCSGNVRLVFVRVAPRGVHGGIDGWPPGV